MRVSSLVKFTFITIPYLQIYTVIKFRSYNAIFINVMFIFGINFEIICFSY